MPSRKRYSRRKAKNQPERPGRRRREYSIEAKQTEFGGDAFRSRLEARWAVWFYLNQIRYNYEFRDPRIRVRYLPDFTIQPADNQDRNTCIVEIKPSPPQGGEKQKLIDYITALNYETQILNDGIILSGSPEDFYIYEASPEFSGAEAKIHIVPKKIKSPERRLNYLRGLLGGPSSKLRQTDLARFASHLKF